MLINKDILNMNIIKLIIKKIAKIIRFRPLTEEEKNAFSKRHSFSKSNDTTINPASGLPMIGCLDVNGNSFGSNSSFEQYRRTHDDFYHSHSFTNYNSSYDSFNNRY